MTEPSDSSALLEFVSGQGLRVKATLDPEHPLLRSFYEGYDRSFVLANEKEALQGFAECLSLNFGEAHAKLVQRYGEFRELVMVAWDGHGSEVGGANFIAYPLKGRVCLNLNYLFVLPTERRRGHFGSLLGAVREAALACFPGNAEQAPLIFIEQNDPVRMSDHDYSSDTALTGLDQLDRILIWAKKGARILDFPYVQPALSKEQAPDPNLVYSVLGASGNLLEACLVRDHLARFFEISVLKAQGLDSSAEASQQIRVLSQACANRETIALLDPMPALTWLRQSAPATSSAAPDLRSLARATATSSC